MVVSLVEEQFLTPKIVIVKILWIFEIFHYINREGQFDQSGNLAGLYRSSFMKTFSYCKNIRLGLPPFLRRQSGAKL